MTAVQVYHGHKRYNNGPPVLNDFSMSVARGGIYALLGPSGCGKTTILSCIVSLHRLDHGHISVFNQTPGQKGSGIPGRTIGYMPQDTALYDIFTVAEIFTYYGGIYGMTDQQVVSRTQFLVNFLHLPQSNRLIRTLSGGQKRRVSLAVALIHSPPLLILDEPTVGVDPLIREKIWHHLLQLVSGGTTVIVTTHYVEEARSVGVVGVMRNGRLLEEKPPLLLLQEHNTNSLEGVVLTLCRNDEVESKVEVEVICLQETKDVVGLTYNQSYEDDLQIEAKHTTPPPLLTPSNFKKIKSLTVRNLLTLMRHPVFLFAFLIIPTVQVTLFNFIIGEEPVGLRLCIINKEFSTLTYCQSPFGGCLHDGLSCSFLDQLQSADIVLDPVGSVEDALDSVRGGRTIGFLTIGANFSINMRDRLLLRNYATTDIIDGSEIYVTLDESDYLMNVFLKKTIYQSYLSFIQSIASSCGVESIENSVGPALQFNPIYKEAGVLEFMQPPQVFTIIFLLPMATALTHIWDKKRGTLDRSLVAGVDFGHVIVSLLVSEGLLIIVTVLICLGVLVLGFGFVVEGSMWLVFGIFLLSGFCGLGFGFLFGTMCDHEIEATVCALAVFLPCFVSAGVTWPREGINPIVKAITSLFPLTLPSESIRSIVSRGWGLTHPGVYPGFLSFGIWALLCSLVSWCLHHRTH